MIAQTVTRPGRRRSVLVCGLAGLLALAAALSGDPTTTRRVRSDPGAVGLLRAAADAARRVPYEGRRFLTTWTRGRASTFSAAVSHTPGDGVRYGSGTGGIGPAHAVQDTTAIAQAPLDLLTRNYSVTHAADAQVCDRRARVVEARREDGSPAGRFWVDAETGLMLRRELIDATGRRVVAAGFSEISYTVPAREPAPYGLDTPRGAPHGVPRGGTARLPGLAETTSTAGGATVWDDRLDRAELAGLRDRGWPVPQNLPGRFSLHDARRDSVGGTVQLRYSDGLAAVSVFVQRGSLDERGMTGWQRAVRHGRTVFRRESLWRWAVSSGDGYVYTVLTAAPQGTADMVAASLPYDTTSFWTRVSRGARRLLSTVNPFD
ncbi:sigma-E factor negative regulatory protein RseB [Actinomadura pelletieri DSM 43383]|uniref:Sigma-E factor negative regulatory protein RseB n=1 Tax=Actinomadura pelletieri DSM 43383 TaxID=1120940 RepID=A0A495QIL3_9ACTN|nr:sigma-E factor regulatory protein RseB domain-containing protein [Actinomadura pelletieri]RKS71876.1 sigma-E factor negative regulatory protein RseB [Actinomadura pelletieri DSM 43383]